MWVWAAPFPLAFPLACLFSFLAPCESRTQLLILAIFFSPLEEKTPPELPLLLGGGVRGSITSFARAESRWTQEGVVAGGKELMHNFSCPKERVQEGAPHEHLREGSAASATCRDQTQPRLLTGR